MININTKVAGVLSMLFGTVGLQYFYLRDWKKGFLCLLFFWSGIPTFLGLIKGASLFSSLCEDYNKKNDF